MQRQRITAGLLRNQKRGSGHMDRRLPLFLRLVEDSLIPAHWISRYAFGMFKARFALH